MSAVFILIVIIGGSTSQSGFAVVQAEFTSRAKCEAARVEIVRIHNYDYALKVRSHGCYEK